MSETTVDLAELAGRYDDPAALVVLDEPEIRWRGYASLIPRLVPIESVEAHPRNPRRGNLDVIARSFSDFGQTKPIVVQASTRWIVAGNHSRLAASDRLGWTHIAAVVTDLDEAKATSYLLADNRSSDLGEYDTSGLIELLDEAAEAGRIAMTGYTADDLDDLIAENERAVRDAAEFTSGLDDGGQIQPERDRDPQGDRLKEVVLLYSEEQFRDVARFLGMCQREWKLSSQSETVAEALRRGAESA